MVPHDKAQGKHIPEEEHCVVYSIRMLNCMERIKKEDNGSGDVGQSEDNKDCLDPSALVL